MLTLVLGLLLAAATKEPIKLEPGLRLDYQGTLALRSDDATAKPGKAFDLTLWISRQNDQGAELFWLVDERGQGAWPWSERFGRLTLDTKWRPSGRGPSVVYDRGDGRGIVPVLTPLVTPRKKLGPDAKWKDERFEYRVDRTEKQDDRDAWVVGVRDGFGLKRVLTIEAGSPVVLAMEERVVMNKGKEYDLKLELIGNDKLAVDGMQSLLTTFGSLVNLRNKLNQGLDSLEIEWKPAQLALLMEQLPRLEEVANGTPLEKLVATAMRDVELQTSRGNALADLAKQSIGKTAPSFSVERLGDGPRLADGDLAGHVTVLHFWDYRDEPLKEPYGQVGYLDFLHHRRKDAGVRVFGVAVDGRLSDEKSRPATLRSIRKLRDFMNLGYPILLDEGSMLKAFGDPRLVGGTLPLVVVIDRQSRITHYHVGHYAVHQDQGIKELDEAVGQALSAPR